MDDAKIKAFFYDKASSPEVAEMACTIVLGGETSHLAFPEDNEIKRYLKQRLPNASKKEREEISGLMWQSVMAGLIVASSDDEEE